MSTSHALSLTLNAEKPPLRIEPSGAVRVGDTRVLLELVISAYLDGESPEKIVEAYDSLSLAEVYAVISYYLRHKEQVDAYMAEGKRLSDEAEAESRRRHADTYAKIKARVEAKRARG